MSNGDQQLVPAPETSLSPTERLERLWVSASICLTLAVRMVLERFTSAPRKAEAITLPTFDGRYLRWFQSQTANLTRLRDIGLQTVENGREATDILWDIIESFPRGEGVSEEIPAAEVEAIRQEAIGQNLGGILQMLPQIIAAIKAFQQLMPAIQELIPILKELFGSFGGGTAPTTTPTTPANPGQPGQF